MTSKNNITYDQSHQQQQIIYNHLNNQSSSSINTPVNHYHHHHHHVPATQIQNSSSTTPSYQQISNEIFKNLQFKQAQINAELIHVQNAIDSNHFTANNKLNQQNILPNHHHLHHSLIYSTNSQNQQGTGAFHLSLTEYDSNKHQIKPTLIRQNQIYTNSPPPPPPPSSNFNNKINIQPFQLQMMTSQPQSAPIISSNQSSRITSPTHMIKHQNEFFPTELTHDPSLISDSLKLSYASVVNQKPAQIINKNIPNLAQMNKKSSVDYANSLNETSLDNQSCDLSLISSNLDESKQNLIIQQQIQINKPANDLKELDLKLGSLLKSENSSKTNELASSHQPETVNELSNVLFSSPSNPISRRNSVDLQMSNNNKKQILPSNLSHSHHATSYTSFNLGNNMNQSINLSDQVDSSSYQSNHDKIINNQQITSSPSLTSSNSVTTGVANNILMNNNNNNCYNNNNNNNSPSTAANTNNNTLHHNFSQNHLYINSNNANDLQYSSLPTSYYNSNSYGVNCHNLVMNPNSINNNSNHEYFTKLFLK
jgi:hypothetical protein